MQGRRLLMNIKIRKFLLLSAVLVLFLFPTITCGQTTKTITLNYSENDFNYEYNAEGELMISSSKYLSSFPHDSISPALPYMMVHVLISDSLEYDGHTFCSNNYSTKDNVKMAMVPNMVPTNLISPSPLPREMKRNFNNYPSTIVQYICSTQMDGCRIVSFLVRPYVYDVTNLRLTLHSNIDIKINLKAAEIIPSTTEIARLNTKQHVSNFIENPEDLEEVFRDYNPEPDPFPYYCDYVIITSNALKNSFLPLVEWKTKKGVKAEIITVEDIYESFNDSTNQLRIKQFIKQYKNQKGLKYVLLGGDDSVVPVLHCLTETWYYDSNDNIVTVTAQMPTDLYYADISDSNPFNWDANGNGIYGEFGDIGTVQHPIAYNVYVTRVPVRTCQQTENFVSKVLAYERNPPTDNWNNRILMTGVAMNNILYDGYKSDSQKGSEEIYNNNIAPYWDGQLFRFFDTESDAPSPYNTVLPENLNRLLTEGFPFVSVKTHGTYISWSLINNNSYSNGHASSYTSLIPTIIETEACNTNGFDFTHNPCLSESFIRSLNSNVIAYYGCSREGFYSSYSYGGPSYEASANFYNTLFTLKEKNFGKAVAISKQNLLVCASFDDMKRWLCFGLNPIGDPETPIFTDVPKLFENINIQLTRNIYNGNQLIINTGVDSCKVCIMTSADNGIGYYNLRRDTNMASFVINPNSYDICVTKQGYIPYCVRCTIGNDELIIQNENITGNHMFFSDSIKIGSNVSNEIEEGPVSVDKGTTTIKASNGVLIKNNFEVKRGAELNIEIANQ